MECQDLKIIENTSLKIHISIYAAKHAIAILSTSQPLPILHLLVYPCFTFSWPHLIEQTQLTKTNTAGILLEYCVNNNTTYAI